MYDITEWRDGLQLPVVAAKINKEWNLKILEMHLEQAIKVCVSRNIFFNSGRIATTLSGGIDSSSALAMIRRISGIGAEIHTFTIVASKKHPDYINAKRIAELFGTVHHSWVVSKKQISRARSKMLSIWPDAAIEDGDVAVFMLYRYISKLGFKCVIAHDGIDELLGGYWKHRKHQTPVQKERAFKYFWNRLKKHHLLPLELKSQYFGIEVLLPYFQEEVIKYISKIPLDDRTGLEISKIPLRKIAGKYLPTEIIERKKSGFCDALK